MTPRVALLTGGSTPERDVALAGATEVVAALRGEGFAVAVVDTVQGALSADQETKLLTGTVDRDPPSTTELALLRERELGPRLVELPEVQDADVVFPVLHGRQGEGGELQALLDLADITYTGSDALGSGIAMAKDVAKALLQNGGIATPDWAMWPVNEERLDALGFPLVVKPSRVGSSVGLSVVESRDGLPAAVDHASTYDQDVLLERYVPGRELTVGVLGDSPLTVGEIIPTHAFFDYECKYTPGMTRDIFPADLSDALTAAAQASALAAHRVLRLRDMSRVDFILSAEGTLFCLEANTLPGLTAMSLLPQSADAAGIDFAELCATLCELALQRAEGTKAAREGF